ncbi:hypothetical protein [Acidihalobacter prosperus]|uniref:Uncharacterized protein n=1 Tax=Acidihalobacter prosperus TaxID=160660 RepID=A0A1A6C374_9GAMM|nr:hypothetical protein [Acidihalobacter prosperus]OBS09012.1 hypothetical protein Thpro_021340 [Acidihalobacter prosperus]
MSIGRLGGLLLLTGLLSLAGCARLPAFLKAPAPMETTPSVPGPKRPETPPPPLPSPSAGIKALLSYAGAAAALSENRQKAVCEQAKARYAQRPDDYARITLATLATVVPQCLSVEQREDLLQVLAAKRDTPYRGLALILRQVAQREQSDAQALAAAHQEIDTLQAKLKALTRIETQLNQVKDRELQNLN